MVSPMTGTLSLLAGVIHAASMSILATSAAVLMHPALSTLPCEYLCQLLTPRTVSAALCLPLPLSPQGARVGHRCGGASARRQPPCCHPGVL
jgi:hypothetical protein